jgi:hypothetical protein
MASPVDQLWHVLLDLSESLTVPWTLVGGQMVLLHALEHGQVPPVPSQDGDVVADLRADHGALAQVVRQLATLGFALESISTDGLAHRYARSAQPRPVLIDVLAPDGLGARADLTTSPPGRTIEVPGGTQALTEPSASPSATKVAKAASPADSARCDHHQSRSHRPARPGATLPRPGPALLPSIGSFRAFRTAHCEGPPATQASQCPSRRQPRRLVAGPGSDPKPGTDHLRSPHRWMTQRRAFWVVLFPGPARRTCKGVAGEKAGPAEAKQKTRIGRPFT